MNRTELHQLLVSARSAQAAYGHAKGTIQDIDGRICMYGAMLLDSGSFNPPSSYSRYNTAAKAMGFEASGVDVPGAVSAMCAWNNAPERTLTEVLARFDAAIEDTKPDPEPVVTPERELVPA